MLFLVIACLCVASGTAYICCPPAQWEGKIGFQSASYISETDQHFMSGGIALSLDGTTGFMAQSQDIEYDGKQVQQRVVADYTKGIINIISPDGSCTRSPTVLNVYPYCIPDNATETQFYFGLNANHVEGKSYYFKYNELDVYMTVTKDGCVPMTQDYYGKLNQAQVMTRLVYVNMTAGITDRSVFNIPDQCNQVAVGPLIPGLGRRSLFH